MSALAIAQALGAARKESRGWRCRCPLHGGVSLTLRNCDSGRLLVWCWGGCAGHDVLAALRRLGLLEGHNSEYRPTREDTARDAARTMRALAIWRESRPIAGTIAERYLLSRGIVFDGLSAEMYAKLHYHAGCPPER
jgi:putative DNA primase/helicase